ncbi:SixA phosphatase family protein [Winogradskyella arenosi]|uniref:Phosphohistidine phosphatase n=1 Tax=Winogradskyella arenosi TaxID=533325 RepID=A0A368ZGC1_9FLAO|nr:histidine phosphatase family protein [Winogradskyella arenosi]RCW92574.1 phosphohistidine phosphatase [Winogradskyella arenosi]
MKEIILVRHGKSSWEYDVLDRERPLKQRGSTDAALVAKEFCKKNSAPLNVFSSPAKRALDTCKIFTTIFNREVDQITIEEELYDFDGRNVIDFIKRLRNDVAQVMIFGHNHALTSISNIFGNQYIDNLPTSGLVKICVDIEDWNALKKGTTELIIIPKDLR